MRIDPIIVVAELRRRALAFDPVIDRKPVLVADHMDLGVFDRRQAVGHHRQTGNAERHGAQDVAIVQRHFEAFVEILVVHVMDAVHRMHVRAREPLHRDVELLHHLFEVEHVARHGRRRRGNLFAGNLVAAAIDGVQQRLREIDARAEELHLLAELHRRDAAGDGVIVAPEWAHQIVVLVLQRRRFLADLHAIALEVLRHVFRPEYRDIRLRCRPEIGQRVQHAIAALGDQRLAVQVHAADAFGRPIGIAAEQRVVFRGSQKAHDTQLLDKLIPQFLGAGLVERSFLQVSLDIDVEEGGDAADRHGGAVRLLDRAKIGKIGPLDGFLRIGCRARDVEAI